MAGGYASPNPKTQPAAGGPAEGILAADHRHSKDLDTAVEGPASRGPDPGIALWERGHIIPLVASILGGLLLSLAFPPFRLDLLAWIALIPLLRVIENENRPAFCFLYAASFGAAFFLVDVRWTCRTMMMHGHFSQIAAVGMMLALVGTLSVFPALFGLITCYLANRGLKPAITAPFVFTATEYARGIAFTGFPWDLLGCSQASRAVLVQIADITGIHGVSFVVVLVNVALWEVFKSRLNGGAIPWRSACACALVLLTALGYGAMRLRAFPSANNPFGGFGIGVLQGNIPQELKWEVAARNHTFDVYTKLGGQAVEQGASLLVWPETAAPVLFGSGDLDSRMPGEISKLLGVPMLVGAPSTKVVQGRPHYYNSAFLIDSGMLRHRYDKIHLVPFGEYMPLSWLLPLGPGMAAREADYSAGEKMEVMRVQGGPPFSVLICYEAIFPELARLALTNGARLLVNITNDGWFGDSAAPYQHLTMAGLRSIENRVWLIRAANTGISAAFDPAGRMVASLPLDHEGVFTVRIPTAPKAGSFYSRMGDVFAWSCILICLFFFISTGVQKYTRSGRSDGCSDRGRVSSIRRRTS